jgi:hypothetical protein
MSALREWAASTSPEAYAAVAVSQWGKWKTACQVWYADPHLQSTLTLAVVLTLDLRSTCSRSEEGKCSAAAML